MLMSVKETWLWNKEGAYGTGLPTMGENPIKTLNGYRKDSAYYSFATAKFMEYQEPFKVDFALLAPGYIEFEKIGDEVNFFSASGELFWKKPINSYPRSGYFGSPVLYLSGDNNTVFLLDTSGNTLSNGELNGRFLADYDFDKFGKGASVLFSGGEVYRVDEKGNTLFFKDLSENRTASFFKSVTLSPNGKYTLIHFSQGQKDFLLILGEKGEIEEEWSLDGFYPHKMYFAINNTMHSLLNLPDRVIFFDKDELVWEEKKLKEGPIFQTAFSMAEIFAYGSEKDIVFLDSHGQKIRTKSMSSSEFPIRLFPGKESDTFYMETKKDIYQFKLFP